MLSRAPLLATSGLVRALVLSSTALCAIGLTTPAFAKDAYLAAVRTCVDAASKSAGSCLVAATSPAGAPVPVWAFVTLSAAEFNAGVPDAATLAQAVVPGPMLTADSGGSLTVHLLNLLPVPVSLVIPGQPGALNPVWTDAGGLVTAQGTRPAGDYKSRVRSLTTETAPGATGSYTWSALNPGSYLYESGTHQAVQVQMGLHGGLVVASGTTATGAATGTAYPGIAYARQVTTYLTEIDTAMHRTIDASPTHDATPTGSAKLSPLEYWPDVFLTTQQVMAPDFTLIPAVGGHGQLQPSVPTLMRFFNATLRSHVQVVQDEYAAIIAEDGHPYRYPKNQYSVLLEAGKTKDAVLMPIVAETVAVYDRMLNTGGAGAAKQGMVAYLDIVAPNTPTAVNDSYTTRQGVTLTVPAKGVLANDVSPDKGALTALVGTTTAYGTLALAANGSFTYTPTAGSTATSDSFSYVAVEGSNQSKPATVTIALTAAPPTANAYAANGSMPLQVAKPGVLGNDTDPPGHGLTATVATAPTHGALTLNADGSFTYTATSGFTGADSFTYTAADGTLKSTPATVTINVASSTGGLMAANDTFTVKISTSGNILDVLTNDTGVPQPPTRPFIVSKPNRGGIAIAQANGTFTYMPKALFVGTDSFTYQFANAAGVRSNVATVTINVTR